MKSRKTWLTKIVCCFFCVLFVVKAHAGPAACDVYQNIFVRPPYQVYVPVLSQELAQSTHGIDWPDCMDDLIRLARVGHSAGLDMLEELGDDAFGHALRFLIEMPVINRNVMEALELVHAADDPVLWDVLILDFRSGRIESLCDPDLERLQTLTPYDPVLAVRYAQSMASMSGAWDFWAFETSKILMTNPGVVHVDELGGKRLRVLIQPMADWLMEQSPEYLEALVEVLAVEHQLELAYAMANSPERLTISTFAELLGQFYKESHEPPGQWLGYLKSSFGDWVLAALPAELRNTPQWNLAHRDLFRGVDPVLHLLGDLLAQMDSDLAVGYAVSLRNHESPVVRRVGTILEWELDPTYSNFENVVASGMSSALLASEANDDDAEALVLSSLDASDPTNLMVFVEHLDCYSILEMSGSERIEQAGDTPVADAIRSRLDECQD